MQTDRNTQLNNILLEKVIKNALIEDLGYGDITTDNILSNSSTKKTQPAVIISKENGILCGGPIINKVFELINKEVTVDIKLQDKQEFFPGTIIASIHGAPENILKGERVALNFLQRLSGIATNTWGMVKLAEPHGVKILDTRKTTPGLRFLEKYAVRTGGGYNHRMGLYDGIMIKDNHIKAAGSIKNALEKINQRVGPMVKVCIEVTTMEETLEAVEHSVDQILLDNMEPDQLKNVASTIKNINRQIKLEASGNIQKDKISKLAKTGIDYISIGKLTHSYSSIDFSLNFLH